MIVKRFPECNENVGSVVNIMGRSDVQVQVQASSSTDKVYCCSVFLSDPVRTPGATLHNAPAKTNALDVAPKTYSASKSAPESAPVSSKGKLVIITQTHTLDYVEPKISQQYTEEAASVAAKEPESSPYFEMSQDQADDLLEGIDDDDDFVADPEQGTRALAHKPWAGAIVAPSNSKDTSGSTGLPDESLVLEHVYGYRTRDCRNNLFYTKSGKIVFPAGSVGVVHDISKNTQRFFHGQHKEDITAVALHPDGKTVASGDVVTHDDGCFVYIWNSEDPENKSSCKKIRIGVKKLARGVADVEFSPDGRYLSVVAMDADHKIYVFDWQKSSKPMFVEKGHNDSVLNGC